CRGGARRFHALDAAGRGRAARRRLARGGEQAGGRALAAGGGASAPAREPRMDEWLLLRLAWQEGRPPFLRLVHRIDRNTTGVLLFARRPEATAPLAKAWREGRVERGYLAIVEDRKS